MDVKWFFRDDPQPFFQWLPGRPPQTIGELFQHRLDLKYEVPGSDLYRRHRAIKIIRPTTELSGTYRCKVSSFIDEDFMQKKMTVYCKTLLKADLLSLLHYRVIQLSNSKDRFKKMAPREKSYCCKILKLLDLS